MSLPGRLREQIMLALLNAFDYGELQILVRTHLETNLAHITPVQGTLQEIVFALLESAEAQGQVRTLLLGAAETRPERKSRMPQLDQPPPRYTLKLPLYGPAGFTAGELS